MQTGDKVEIRGRVKFTKDVVNDWDGNRREGVVTRGFQVIEVPAEGEAFVWEGGLLFLDLPDDIGIQMPEGSVHEMSVRRRGPKRNKDVTDPLNWNYEIDHHHGMMAQNDTQESPARSASPAAPAKPAAPAMAFPDPTRDSIESQKAADLATRLLEQHVAFYHQDRTPEWMQWDGWFMHIKARIQGTAAPADAVVANDD